jgi:ribose transport system permease protein
MEIAKLKTRSPGAFAEMLKGTSSELSIVLAFVVLCVFFGLASPYFFTVRNIMNIGTYASIMGTMAAGLTVAMLIGGLDVSQYSMAAMAGMVMGIMIERQVNPALTIGLTLLIGVVGGLINAFVVTKMKINPIIATMGTQSVFRGTAFLLTDGRYIRIDHPVFNYIGNGKVLGIPFCLIIMAVVYVLVFYILKYTKFGREVFAVGGNPVASRLSGVNNDKVRFISFLLSGLTAAIGGIITVSQTAAAMPNHGFGNDMDGIAAVILGGISLAGGKGKVTGTLIGILILATLTNGMTLLNVQSYWQMVIKGLVLVLAVYADTLRGGGYK